MKDNLNRYFTFENKEYEIRIAFDSSTGEYKATVFCEEKRANIYEYCMNHFDALDAKHDGMPFIGHLYEIAESDVRNKVYENYLRAVRSEN